MMFKPQKYQIALALGIGAILVANLVSCVSIPKGARAVQPFEKDRYLGKWYEIARMDFKFEKNLNQVTAEYSSNKDGSIKVDNRGFNFKEKEWKESIGKAKFVKSPDLGRLKVSFFGPFYSGYNVIKIDPDYRYALVVGNNLKYLWILSREKTIPADIRKDYLNEAKRLGYNVEELVWTKQD